MFCSFPPPPSSACVPTLLCPRPFNPFFFPCLSEWSRLPGGLLQPHISFFRRGRGWKVFKMAALVGFVSRDNNAERLRQPIPDALSFTWKDYTVASTRSIGLGSADDLWGSHFQASTLSGAAVLLFERRSANLPVLLFTVRYVQSLRTTSNGTFILP